MSHSDPDRLDKLREEFDEWADAYEADLEQPAGVLVGFAEARTRAAALLDVHPGDIVVDIGVGTGLFAELIGARGASIIGVDLSPRMITLCAAKHPAWEYFEGHFLELPLPSSSVDAAISAFASHHLGNEEWPAALQEVMRVLRPGGRFLLVDILFADQRAKDAARERLGSQWEEENYPVYPMLARVAHTLSLRTTFTALTPLHAAVLFESAR